MTTPQPSHTPGLVEVRDDGDLHIVSPDLLENDSDYGVMVYVAYDERARELDVRLFAASRNSYAKHCGPRAVECAENDLLGEALDSIRQAIWGYDNGDSDEHTNGWKSMRAVLAKASGGES